MWDKTLGVSYKQIIAVWVRQTEENHISEACIMTTALRDSERAVLTLEVFILFGEVSIKSQDTRYLKLIDFY